MFSTAPDRQMYTHAEQEHFALLQPSFCVVLLDILVVFHHDM